VYFLVVSLWHGMGSMIRLGTVFSGLGGYDGYDSVFALYGNE
jgi:hypothetical protein